MISWLYKDLLGQQRQLVCRWPYKQSISLALNHSACDCLINICQRTYRAFRWIIESEDGAISRATEKGKSITRKAVRKVFNYLSLAEYNKLASSASHAAVKRLRQARLFVQWIIHSQFSLTAALIYVPSRFLRLLAGPCLFMINNRP